MRTMIRRAALIASLCLFSCGTGSRPSLPLDAADPGPAPDRVEIVDTPEPRDTPDADDSEPRNEPVDTREVDDVDATWCLGSAPDLEVRLCRQDAVDCARIEDILVPHLRGTMRLAASLSCRPAGLTGIEIAVSGAVTACAGKAECEAVIDAMALTDRRVTVTIDATWTGPSGNGVHRTWELPVYACTVPQGEQVCLRYGSWQEEVLQADVELDSAGGIDVHEQPDGSFHVYLFETVKSPESGQYESALGVFAGDAGGNWVHERLQLISNEQFNVTHAVDIAVIEDGSTFELLVSSLYDAFIGRRDGNDVTFSRVVQDVTSCVGLDSRATRLGANTRSIGVAVVNGVRHVLFVGPAYYVSASDGGEWTCVPYPESSCGPTGSCTYSGRQVMQPDGHGGLVAVSTGVGGLVLGRFDGAWTFTQLGCDPECVYRIEAALAQDRDGRAHFFTATSQYLSESIAEFFSYDSVDPGGAVHHESLDSVLHDVVAQLPLAFASGWMWGLDSDVDACGRVHTVFSLVTSTHEVPCTGNVLVEATDLTGRWTATPFLESRPHRVVDNASLASHSSFHITKDGAMHLFAIRRQPDGPDPDPLDCARAPLQLSHWVRRCAVYLEP